MSRKEEKAEGEGEREGRREGGQEGGSENDIGKGSVHPQLPSGPEWVRRVLPSEPANSWDSFHSATRKSLPIY